MASVRSRVNDADHNQDDLHLVARHVSNDSILCMHFYNISIKDLKLKDKLVMCDGSCKECDMVLCLPL